MGVTISSKRHSCDMGYAGFNRFRNTVAAQASNEFYNHYMLLTDPEVMNLDGTERKKFFRKYDTDTIKHIKNNKVTASVAIFLFQPDCEGDIDRKQAKEIYDLIKDCDDSIVFGYVGREDCARMADMKRIFSDKTKVEWS